MVFLVTKKKSNDVTDLIRDIVEQQGGNQLRLKPGPKKDLLGNPAEGKKKHLVILYSCNGVMNRKCFKDADPVFLDINTINLT